MEKRKKWGLFFAVIWLVSFPSLSGQEFSDFFIDFLRYPENQAKHVQFPLKADNATVKGSSSYNSIVFPSRNNIPVLCSDSLNAIMNLPSSVVSIVQFNKNAANNYVFEQRNKGWKLMSYKSETIQNLQEAEFLNFLMQYSKDEAFQMKHTAFPFPYRIYKSSNRNSDPENKLLMPREWATLDFVALFPSLCIFNSNNQPNRQLFVFKGAKAAQFFNFIRINKKWYLIEIEEYR
jgi:hypothetical protein